VDAAYAALCELVRYPYWWLEVKEARKLDEDHLWMRTRSRLPYDLAFTLDRTVADPRAHLLEAEFRGALEGRIHWAIEPTDGGCLITFDEKRGDEQGRLERAGAHRAAGVRRQPRALTMAHGQARLRTFLSGYAFGREQAATADPS